MAEVDESCAEPKCKVHLPPYPDESGTYWCREHYPEPNGGTFDHLEDIDPEYRQEKIEEYN